MKIYREDNLSNFEFWAGAKSNAAMLTDEELDNIGSELEVIYSDSDGMSETEINDIFWFDFAFACELIGLEYDEEEDVIIR